MSRLPVILLVVMLSVLNVCRLHGQAIRVGAKHFTEGYLLSEMIALILEDEGFTVERKFNLGGTMVCFSALQHDEIDIYPEYTGTLSAEILKLNRQVPLDTLKSLLEKQQLGVSGPYGFENKYALVMSRVKATSLRIENISDLRAQSLRIGVSYEFLKRQDGWENLAATYGLEQNAFGMEHGLAYSALRADKMDVTDAYSTDGEINYYDLIVLDDDLQYFPDYRAVSLYRHSLPPAAIRAVNKLVGSISETEMQSLNSEVLFGKRSYGTVAASFLARKGLIRSKRKATEGTSAADVLSKVLTHLKLTLIALVLSVLVALPLSVFVYWNERLSATVLYTAGLLQTIPSIALLAVLIPITGIGVLPAIIALFLYGLLPILRSTVTGLRTIDPALKKVAEGLGMSAAQKLRYLELPLATPAILAGIRTAAVINIGTATLAAFIGAGGLGEYIVTGLALNNYELILTGAIPAALLAIFVELAFELVQRVLIPRYMDDRQ
ncbi:glycine betaine ABC transporter substrate-binding protein [Chryseolinea sp. T2]|uniref:glycine betaine ABC transporter substrate-binding protein n=1 Tax=Chryseolinea sp. T2 TaxID=3129255 RepID=UPI00307874FA